MGLILLVVVLLLVFGGGGYYVNGRGYAGPAGTWGGPGIWVIGLIIILFLVFGPYGGGFR